MKVIKASENPYEAFDVIPTGFQNLDEIIGVGGIPTKKITELSGPWSVGKSTMALTIVAKAQQQGFECLWVDSEFSFSGEYAKVLGADVGQLDFFAGRFAEECLDTISEWADSHKNALICLDSVGGLLPRQESENGASGRQIGAQARLIASFCRKIVPILAINNIALLVLNHEFKDIMTGNLMTSGGAKLSYHKSLWIKLGKAGKRIMQSDKQIGEVIKAEIRKNKLAPTVKQSCELQMFFGRGFNAEFDLLKAAVEKGIITRSGNTFWFGKEKLGTIGKVRKALENVELVYRIKSQLESELQ